MMNVLVKLLVGFGGLSIGNCCLGAGYEPEIPEELV